MAKGIKLLGKFIINFGEWQVREVIAEGVIVRYATYVLNGNEWVYEHNRVFNTCSRGHIMGWGRILSDEEVKEKGLDSLSALRAEVEPMLLAQDFAVQARPVLRDATDEMLISVLQERGYAVLRAGNN